MVLFKAYGQFFIGIMIEEYLKDWYQSMRAKDVLGGKNEGNEEPWGQSVGNTTNMSGEVLIDNSSQGSPGNGENCKLANETMKRWGDWLEG